MSVCGARSPRRGTKETTELESLRTTTTSGLLEALLEPGERTAWSEFDHRYRPILFAFGRKLGLDPEAAAEVAQESLVDFSTDYHAGRYDRERGRLRSWLIGIARHRVSSYLRDRGRRRELHGHSTLDQMQKPELEEAWESARRLAILERGLEELRTESKTSSRTLRVFSQVALEHLPAEQVAATNDMTVAEVYRVKYRLTRRLREIVQHLESIYVDDV